MSQPEPTSEEYRATWVDWLGMGASAFCAAGLGVIYLLAGSWEYRAGLFLAHVVVGLLSLAVSIAVGIRVVKRYTPLGLHALMLAVACAGWSVYVYFKAGGGL